MKWLILIVISIPFLMFFPIEFFAIVLSVYMTIPVLLLYRHMKRNLRWGEAQKEHDPIGEMMREQRAKEKLIRSMNLDPDEERVVRSDLVLKTLRKLEER